MKIKKYKSMLVMAIMASLTISGQVFAEEAGVSAETDIRTEVQTSPLKVKAQFRADVEAKINAERLKLQVEWGTKREAAIQEMKEKREGIKNEFETKKTEVKEAFRNTREEMRKKAREGIVTNFLNR